MNQVIQQKSHRDALIQTISRVAERFGYQSDGPGGWTRVFTNNTGNIRTRVSFYVSSTGVILLGSSIFLDSPGVPSLKFRWDDEEASEVSLAMLLERAEVYFSGP
ncbi:MAG: hypothetical protein CL942_14205 [Desulfovibrio sp.]|nr:hypothetical protein [Desulfovibrio sp.]